MKQIIILLLFLQSCKPIQKVEMPHTGEPPKIEYSKEFDINISKEDCHDKIFKEFLTICPTLAVNIDSRSAGVLQLKGDSKYTLRGGPGGVQSSERKFTFLLSVTISENKCKIVINNIRIQHRGIEYFYYHKTSRVAVKNLNPSYTEINNKVNEIINRLGEQGSLN